MPFLFELVYSGENAFHITVADFYTIDFTNAPEIQSILGFEFSVLERRVNNPRHYSWVHRATRGLWRTAPRLTCYRCFLNTIHFWSSSKLLAVRWWRCFPLYRWWSRMSMWHSMSKKKDSTLIVKVRTRQSIVLVGLQVQIVSIHSQYVRNTYFVWFCFWSEWSIPVWCDERLRFMRKCIPRSLQCRIGLWSEYLGLPIYPEASRDIHNDE